MHSPHTPGIMHLTIRMRQNLPEARHPISPFDFLRRHR